MRLRMIATGFALGLATALATGHAVSQEPDAAEMENMMRVWQEMASPGDPHKRLTTLVGDWDVTMRIWMAGPNVPPTETKGRTTNKMIMGGRFLMSEMKGSMMGMPMEGLGITGYDNFKKKYISVWLDSNGTAIHRSEGLADQSGKTVTYYGTMDEWLTGEHDKPVKYVERLVTDDEMIFEIHDLGIVPGETKVMEMVYTRRKDAGVR